jgi:predicted unusual protein kinase regulating ubiquinone biosynthesis (AarF/ABC1/UbiB family)
MCVYCIHWRLAAAEHSHAGTDRYACLTPSLPALLLCCVLRAVSWSDPHPGNVAVTKTAEGGPQLIYYDFGMTGSIPGDVRGGLMELFYG